jgi:hypothetical protein
MPKRKNKCYKKVIIFAFESLEKTKKLKYMTYKMKHDYFQDAKENIIHSELISIYDVQ